MRILHTADLHLGVSRYHARGDPYSRLRDFAATCERFVAAAAKAPAADLAIISGDLFDTRHPRPRELAVAARFLRDLTDVCHVALVPGNHDGMWTIGEPESATLRFLRELDLPNLHALIEPGVTPVAGAAIVAIPYPHKRAYDVVHPDIDPLLRQERIAADLEHAIALMCEEAEVRFTGQPLIFVGHVAVAGGIGGSERAMRLEDDIMLSPSIFDAFDYAALGHLHRQQKVSSRAWYAGAPEYISFGEVEDPKAFLSVRVAPGEKPVIKAVPSGARRMMLLPFEAKGMQAITDLHVTAKVPAGAIVRVRLTLDVRPPAAALRTLVDGLYAAGASYVDTEVIVPAASAQRRERALGAGVGDTDALKAWLAAQGLPQEPYLSAAEEVFGGS